MFVRIYLCVRYLFYLSGFMSPRTHRVCTINGSDSDSMFALRGLMKMKPFPIILGALGLSILIFGYMLRIVEYPLRETSGYTYDQQITAMWNVVITLTSTGYGDLYPSTYIGRTVAMAVCFWGFVIISLFVVAV